jgi:ABC-2 type transport system ATP-binding protein
MHEIKLDFNFVYRDLTKVYNKFLAVDHLNFAVKPGECFGLLGVNGAGLLQK